MGDDLFLFVLLLKRPSENLGFAVFENLACRINVGSIALLLLAK
ncbi:hypothetical protein l11_01740 [Neisseria weaveri LMG 5135]|nr:hypothetical protein l13_11230 [Neisseria weaveri ATCC 51223]EGV38727.1 hypothetical protein l11_01740 [Neisseria weaveri LMG 5135]